MAKIGTLREVPIGELRPTDNPRRITEERFESLRLAIREAPEMLRVRPVIARPDGGIVAGEMRWRAADAEGLTTIPSVDVEFDSLEEEREWRLRDNNPYGEYVEQELAEMLYDLEQAGRNLEMTGFTREETTKLLDSVRGTKGPNRWPDDPAPSPPEHPRSKPGQVYKLGRHRLMCGDATNPAHVGKLLNGAKPTLMVTDPPYGVQLELGHQADLIDGEWVERKGPAGRGTRKGARGHTSMQGDDRHDWSEAYELVPSLTVAYVFFADVYVAEVLAGLRRVGLEISQFIVWDKIAFALSRAHYHWRHEAAIYAIRTSATTEVPWYGPVADLAVYARQKGTKVPFLGARDQPTIWSAPSPKRRLEGAEAEVDHPTQKPTLLYTRPIQNHLLTGEALYEPFAGSGTALIAAEMTGRACYAMEIDPAFVDVCRDRYKLFMEGE